MTGKRLLKPGSLQILARRSFEVQREDLALLGITFFATLSLGIKQGIAVGVIASLLWVAYKTTKPHYAVLGRIKDSKHYRNEKNYQVEKVPHTLIMRFDAHFYYGNVSFLKEKLRKSEVTVNEPLKYIIFDASGVNNLDSSADQALHEMLRDYRERNIDLYFAGLKGPVLDVMRKSGFLDKLGDRHVFFDVHEAVASLN